MHNDEQHKTVVDMRFFINIFYNTEFKQQQQGAVGSTSSPWWEGRVVGVVWGDMGCLEVGLVLRQLQLPRYVARGDGTLTRNVRSLAEGVATDAGEEKSL